MNKLIIILFSILLFSCDNSDTQEINKLLAENIEVIERVNDLEIDNFYRLKAGGNNLLNNNLFHLLSINYYDSIPTDTLNIFISKFDDHFFKVEKDLVNNSKDDYNNSLLSNDSLISKNYLEIFKNHLINFTYQSFNYCGPDSRFNKIKVFSQIITNNPTTNNEVEMLFSLGAFDSSYVYKIYLGGYNDSLGLNSSLITDTLLTENGFGRYKFNPKESGLQTISGVMELKTKFGPKYYPFSTDVYIRK
tara:strand:+ start:104 stop:847 length:744 start_codon:yes stop_codon:yes gene_type:complete